MQRRAPHRYGHFGHSRWNAGRLSHRNLHDSAVDTDPGTPAWAVDDRENSKDEDQELKMPTKVHAASVALGGLKPGILVEMHRRLPHWQPEGAGYFVRGEPGPEAFRILLGEGLF